MMETLEGGELCFPQLLNTSCRKPMRPHSEVMLLFILLSSISLLTVSLNLLVIISISHYRQLHTPTNLILLSLAVSDFLTGLILMPAAIFITVTCWFLGDFMCALYYFVAFILTSASVANMVLISVDRYVAICDPLHYPTKMTHRRVKICVFLCWACSAFGSGLLLKDLLRQPGRYNSCVGECVVVINYFAGTFDLVFNFTAPIAVIIVLYMRVFVVAVSQARAMRSHIVAVTLQRSVTVTAKKSEMKAARTLGIAVVVFLMCFCPYYCASLAGQDTEINGLYFVVWLFYCTSCLNPVIYAFFYPWFRKSINLIIRLQILQPDSCEANIMASQEKYFAEATLGDARDLYWLKLMAANRLQIPYVGYAVLNMEVGGLQVPNRGVIIVADRCLGSDYGVLGINVIQHCWESVFQEFQGTAKLPRQAPVQIDPETEKVLLAQVPQASEVSDCLVMVEDLDDAIQTGTDLVLGFIGPNEVEVDVRRVSQVTPGDHPVLSLKGENLSSDKQRRLTELLQEWMSVFTADEDDFGHTDVVLHHIPTGDAPPCVRDIGQCLPAYTRSYEHSFRMRRWVKGWERLEIRDGVLGRKFLEPGTKAWMFQVVVPFPSRAKSGVLAAHIDFSGLEYLP
ncbi:trace amine-associated receptor 13c-like [Centroberyx affinis]|uniref:trace amine-associated receptor 13c-like n=1 Tax=Centroberyx affinis TaxID=166261 RepID=UPI003A5C28AA